MWWRLLLLIPALSFGWTGIQILLDLESCKWVAIGAGRLISFTCLQAQPQLGSEVFAAEGLATGLLLVGGSLLILLFVAWPFASAIWVATPIGQRSRARSLAKADDRGRARTAKAESRDERIADKRKAKVPGAEGMIAKLRTAPDAAVLVEVMRDELPFYDREINNHAYRREWVHAAMSRGAELVAHGDEERFAAAVNAMEIEKYGYGRSPVKSLYAPDPTFMSGLIAFTVLEGEMDVEPLAYSDANEIVNAPPSIPETESIPKDAWFCPHCRNWHDDQTLARCPSCDRRRAGH